jgi:hypothetical protein
MYSLIPETMKKIISLSLLLFSIVTFYSCVNIMGKWDDNIHLSIKSAGFNAAGDSVIIKTEGTTWWLTGISVDATNYYDFREMDLLADKYSFQRDDIFVERRDKNTLFVRADANPLELIRTITIWFEAGDYFDRVTITQKPK